jgi:trigger factor
VKTTVSEQGKNTVRLDIEVPAEDVQAGIDATIRKLSREVKLPGFRKGKVPLNLVVQRFGMPAIIHQMLEDYLQPWYETALAESGVEPVDRPEVDYDDEPEEGKPFAFRADVTVMPTAELGQYKGLEVPRDVAEVQDAEVDAQVERLQREFGELRPVTDRPAVTGDFVTVDFAGVLDGQPIEQTGAQDYVMELGTGRVMPDLEQGIVGMSADEERVVPVSFPEDYGAEDVAGKTVDFTVKVKEVKEKVLPPLNDEFAKDVSEFETLLELRLDIRKRLQGVMDGAADRRFRAAAIKAATDNATADIPAVVIDGQARDMVEDFARSLQMQGTDFQTYLAMTGGTVQHLLDEIRPQAEDTVKTGLMLEAVAQAEALEITDEELDQRIVQKAAMKRTEPGELRPRLEESGRMTTVRQQLLREKAADLVVEHAIAVAPPEEPEAPVAAPEPSEAEDETIAVTDGESATTDDEPGAGEAEQPADQ